MVIAVFDSGLGSLSIIKAIQRTIKSDIIYFADQENFPYGNKTKSQLNQIIQKTITKLQDFAPDVIIMASNTPSLILNYNQVIGVYPPIKEAVKLSKTKNIAILGTKAAISSRGLSNYITKQDIPQDITIHKINASSLVELVESGKFLSDKTLCKNEIKSLLSKKFKHNNIDVATLSSTHLPFMKEFFVSELGVKFLDPADDLAKKVKKIIKNKSRNRLKIYTNGNTKIFEEKLAKLGIKNRVNYLTV